MSEDSASANNAHDESKSLADSKVQADSQSQYKHIALAAGWLKAASHGAVLTGAGISRESGIATFRESREQRARSGDAQAKGVDGRDLTPLWEKYDPADLATPSAFQKNPELVWQWYDYRRRLVLSVSPNAGHLALAELENLVAQFTVITQNVDRLHDRAGSKKILELHGDILSFRCFNRGHQAADVPLGLERPPLCEHSDCRSMLRPNVVWFGESLPPDALARATRIASTSEVFLVVGTSGLVQPAASLPFAARRGGAKLVEINPARTAISDQVDLFLSGTAGEILPLLIAQLKAV